MASLYREEGASRPQRSLYQAEAFLKSLDPSETRWEFIAIREAHSAPSSWWATDEYKGDLNSIGYALERDNRYSGIHVKLNTEDRIRAIWQTDQDQGIGSKFGLKPSWIVAPSPGKWIAYWFISDLWTNDVEGRRDFYRATGRLPETSIETFHRLPGFFSHRESQGPFLVKTIHRSKTSYSKDQLLEALSA
jgi:hypothetical protein